MKKVSPSVISQMYVVLADYTTTAHQQHTKQRHTMPKPVIIAQKGGPAVLTRPPRLCARRWGGSWISTTPRFTAESGRLPVNYELRMRKAIC